MKYFVAIHGPDDRSIALISNTESDDAFNATPFDSEDEAEDAAEANDAACALGYTVFGVAL